MGAWLRTEYSEIELRCARETDKTVKMQIHYEIHRIDGSPDTEWTLSPFMNCHNEYGLPQCNICKQKLYEFLTSQDGWYEQPIELNLKFE